MNRSKLFLVTIAATFVAGCASVDTRNAEPRESGTVVTGSRIPGRDGASTSDVKSITNKGAIDDMMGRGSIISTPPKGGGM